jgi:hypothetical protein
VLGLTAVALRGGGEDSTPVSAKDGTKPSATGSAIPGYAAPPDWTDPGDWVALPKASSTDAHGSPVGYPHSVEGAVAAAAATQTTSVEGETSNSDEQKRIYLSYVAAADQDPDKAEKLAQKTAEGDRQLAQDSGVQPGQPLPPGAYLRSRVVGFKIISKSADQVTMWLLIRGVQKTGETAQEKGHYARVSTGLQWVDGDWKLTGTSMRVSNQDTGETPPQIAAPGDTAFNAAGWTAIREAS